MRLTEDSKHDRAAFAAEQWVRWRCMDLPAFYRMGLPVSYSAKEMLEGEILIRQIFAVDILEAETNPIRELGPLPTMIDFTDCPQMKHLAGVKPGQAHPESYGLLVNPNPDFRIHPEVFLAQGGPENADVYAKQLGLFVMLGAQRRLEKCLEFAQREGHPDWKVEAIQKALATMVETIKKQFDAFFPDTAPEGMREILELQPAE